MLLVLGGQGVQMLSSLAQCVEKSTVPVTVLVTVKLSIWPKADSFSICVLVLDERGFNYLLHFFISRNEG